jgi:hypothetical protein
MSGEERLINVELLNDLGGLSDNGEGNEGHKKRGLVGIDVLKNVEILSSNGESDKVSKNHKRGLIGIDLLNNLG